MLVVLFLSSDFPALFRCDSIVPLGCGDGVPYPPKRVFSHLDENLLQNLSIIQNISIILFSVIIACVDVNS